MGGIEEDYKKGRGGLQGGVNVLQGGVIGGALIWLGVSGTVSGNGENRGRDIMGRGLHQGRRKCGNRQEISQEQPTSGEERGRCHIGWRCVQCSRCAQGRGDMMVELSGRMRGGVSRIQRYSSG